MIERHCPRCDSEVELDGERIVAVIMNGKRYVEERTCHITPITEEMPTNSALVIFGYACDCCHFKYAYPDEKFMTAVMDFKHCPNCGARVERREQ